jgi:hypothetical protein
VPCCTFGKMSGARKIESHSPDVQCMPRELLSMLESAGMVAKDDSGENSSSSRHRQASFAHSAVHRAASAVS